MKLLLNFGAIGGGVIGSFLIATNSDFSKWGYALFLISAACSVAIQLPDKSQRGLLCLSVFYVSVNIFGLLRWFEIV